MIIGSFRPYNSTKRMKKKKGKGSKKIKVNPKDICNTAKNLVIGRNIV